MTEVRLVDAEHLLHDHARHADLLADVPHALTRELPRHDRELDVVCVVDRDLRLPLGERCDREALAERPVELVAVLLDLHGLHSLRLTVSFARSRWSRVVASPWAGSLARPPAKLNLAGRAVLPLDGVLASH